MTDPNAAASAEAYMQYFQNMGAYGNMMPMMTTDQMGIIPNLMQQPPTQGLSVGGRGHRDISSLGNEHCKYWRFGRCARGETCFYKHDPAFLGVDRPGSNGVPLASPIPTPGMSMAAHMGSYPGYQQQYVAANQQYMGAGQFIDFNSTSIGGRQYGQSAAAAAGAAAAAAAAAAQAAAPLVYVAGGRRFNGFVRSYSTLNGFGFIGGDEINEVIGQDVFLHQREIAEVTGDAKPSLASGTTLSFTVIRNQKGQPQARDLVFDDPGQAGTQAKIDADIAKFQNYVATAGKEGEEDKDKGSASRRLSRSRSPRRRSRSPRTSRAKVSDDGLLRL